MTATRARLHGIGTATPDGTVDQETAAGFGEARCCSSDRQRTWLHRVYRNSGVRRRASVLLGPGGETAGAEAFFPSPVSPEDGGPTTAERLQRYCGEAGPLAVEACQAAFRDGRVDPSAITHVVTVSCTGLASPGLDAELIRRLELPPDVGRLNLGFMGCHGALNGLRAAGALAQCEPGARVLLCCVELCSLHFCYGWDPQRIVANALFADGAGAVIVGPGEGSVVDGWHLLGTASRLIPESTGMMSWRIGDHGFVMTLSQDVPARIGGLIGPWLDTWLARYGLTVDGVAQWAVHPGGPRIIQTVVDSLGLPEGAGRASAEVLAEHGNMSSPTVLFILERLRARVASGPCAVLGFGPGLSLEAALLG